MKDILDFGKDIWKAPVWSVIISAAILAVVGGKLHIILRIRLWKSKKVLDEGFAKRT